jgi:hypothetical protein
VRDWDNLGYDELTALEGTSGLTFDETLCYTSTAH